MPTPLALDASKSIQVRILRQIVDICNDNGLTYYAVGGTLLGGIRHLGFIPWDDDIDIALPRPDFEALKLICRSRLPKEYRYVDYCDDPRIPNNISKVFDTRTALIEEAREGFQVKIGVYVDIFPLDGVPQNPCLRFVHGASIRFLRLVMTLTSLAHLHRRPLHKRILIRFVQMLIDESRMEKFHTYLERLMTKYDYFSGEEVCNYPGAWGDRERCPRSWFAEGTNVDFEGISIRGVKEFDKYLSRMYGDYMSLPPIEQRQSHHRHEVWLADERSGEHIE